MKINELSPTDKERLYYEARSLFDWEPREELADPPTLKQLYALKVRGFIIGPNQEVLRPAMTGNLRECVHGIPCTYYCQGWADEKCKEIPFPVCGIADGACLLTNKPCNSSCKNNEILNG